MAPYMNTLHQQDWGFPLHNWNLCTLEAQAIYSEPLDLHDLSLPDVQYEHHFSIARSYTVPIAASYGPYIHHNHVAVDLNSPYPVYESMPSPQENVLRYDGDDNMSCSDSTRSNSTSLDDRLIPPAHHHLDERNLSQHRALIGRALANQPATQLSPYPPPSLHHQHHLHHPGAYASLKDIAPKQESDDDVDDMTDADAEGEEDIDLPDITVTASYAFEPHQADAASSVDDIMEDSASDMDVKPSAAEESDYVPTGARKTKAAASRRTSKTAAAKGTNKKATAGKSKVKKSSSTPTSRRQSHITLTTSTSQPTTGTAEIGNTSDTTSTAASPPQFITNHAPKARRKPSRNLTTTTLTTLTTLSPLERRRKTRTTTVATAAATPEKKGYPCVLAPYGCSYVFGAKNEWKRHARTQHVKEFFYRCDICLDQSRAAAKQSAAVKEDSKARPTAEYDSVAAAASSRRSSTTSAAAAKAAHAAASEPPNDFNRKDLYVQHLKRMHASLLASPDSKYAPLVLSSLTTALSRTPTAADIAADLVKVVDHKSTPHSLSTALLEHLAVVNYLPLRTLPRRVSCPLPKCGKVFEGQGAWEERMEHLAGQHFEVLKKEGRPVPASEEWVEDRTLTAWYVEEGLVEPKGKGWEIGKGVPKRKSG